MINPEHFKFWIWIVLIYRNRHKSTWPPSQKTTSEFVEAATWYSTGPSYFNDVCVQMSTMAGRDTHGTIWLCLEQEPPVSLADVLHFLLLSSGTLFRNTFDRHFIDCRQFSRGLKLTCLSRPTCSEKYLTANWTELVLYRILDADINLLVATCVAKIKCLNSVASQESALLDADHLLTSRRRLSGATVLIWPC